MDEKMVSPKNRLKYGVVSYFNDPMNQSVQWSVIRFFPFCFGGLVEVDVFLVMAWCWTFFVESCFLQA